MRKKLFAVIMSVMMMVTFMPAMAFAAVSSCDTTTHKDVRLDITWGADYSTAEADVYCANCAAGGENTYLGYVEGKVTRTFDIDTGIVKAEAEFNGIAEDCISNPDALTKYYVDMTGANLVNAKSDEVQKSGKKYTKITADQYLDLKDAKSYRGLFNLVEFVQPVGTINSKDKKEYDGKSSKPYYAYSKLEQFDDYYFVDFPSTRAARLGENELALLRIEITDSGYEAYEADKNVDFTVLYEVYGKAVSGNEIDVIGLKDAVTTETVAVTLKGTDLSHLGYTTKSVTNGKLRKAYSTIEKAIEKARFVNTKFGEASANTVKATYVGEDQSFQISSKNVTAEFYTVDKLGNPTAISSLPEMKNVMLTKDPLYHDDAYHFIVKATVGTNTKYYPVALHIDSAKALITFKQSQFVFGQGLKVKNSDLLKVQILDVDKVSVSNEKYNKVLHEGLYPADQKFSDELLNNYVTVNGVIDTLGVSPLNCALTNYEAEYEGLTEEEIIAKVGLEKVQFVANYSLKADTVKSEFVRTNQKNFVVTGGTQKKTVNTKKGMKSFKIKGVQVGYGTKTFKKLGTNHNGGKKIVVKNGKVYVKKSLKKGTYTVKVLVTVPGAHAVKTIKVTVKK